MFGVFCKVPELPGLALVEAKGFRFYSHTPFSYNIPISLAQLPRAGVMKNLPVAVLSARALTLGFHPRLYVRAKDSR